MHSSVIPDSVRPGIDRKITNTCLTVCEKLAGGADCHYSTASNNSALLFFGEFICLLIGVSSTAGSHPTSPKHVGQSSGWRTVAEGELVQGGIGVQVTVIRRSARRPSNGIIRFTRAGGRTVVNTVGSWPRWPDRPR